MNEIKFQRSNKKEEKKKQLQASLYHIAFLHNIADNASVETLKLSGVQ